MTDTLLGVVEKPFRMRVPNQHVLNCYRFAVCQNLRPTSVPPPSRTLERLGRRLDPRHANLY